MKKIAPVLLLALLLSGCATSVQGLVGLPAEARILVMTLVTAGFTALLLVMSNLLKINLGGYVEPLAAIFAPIVITFLEKWLGMIPTAYDSLVLTVIHFIVLLIGSIGTVIIVRRVQNQNTQSLLS